MSIRLRKTEIGLVALCAARSIPKTGDVYLDDNVHQALSVKFDLDFANTGVLPGVYKNTEVERIIEREEANNSNRKDWDLFFKGGEK